MVCETCQTPPSVDCVELVASRRSALDHGRIIGLLMVLRDEAAKT
jgi:hypothetical protein